MTKKLLFGLAFTIVMAAACNKTLTPDVPTTQRLSASVESALTKSTIDIDGAVGSRTATFSWSVGDKIAVVTEEKSFAEFTYDGTAFESTSTAVPTMGAIYPFNASYDGSFLSSGIAKLILPDSYGSLSEAYAPSTNMPMLAQLTGSKLDFKHAAGVAMFTIKELPATAAKVVFKANTNITGEFTLSDAAADLSHYGTISLGEGEGDGQSVSILFSAFGSKQTDVDFYFPLPLGDYSGFILEIKDAENNNLAKITSAASFTVTRANIKYFTLEPVFKFQDTEVSFNYSENKLLDFAAMGVKDITVKGLPEGWTSMITENQLSLIAPTSGATSTDITLSGTSFAGTPMETAPLRIRIKGFNNLEELLAFREAYGATSDTPVTTGHEKYMRDGELCLNTDITLNQSTIKSSAYFIKYLNIPLNGGGNTLTVNYTATAAIASVFQYIKNVAVHDLNLAGQITNNVTAATRCASLAAIIMNGATITNVTSSVDITYNATSYYASQIGGIIGEVNGTAAVTMTNCEYNGTMTINAPVNKVGGIIAASGNGASEQNTFTNCRFAGTLNYTQTIAHTQQIRLGGIVGDAARLVECNNCSFTGNMTFNLNNLSFITVSSGKGKAGSGIGGIVGRNTAKTSSVTNMKLDLINCESSGNITIKNALAADSHLVTTLSAETDRSYGLTIGQIPNGAQDEELTITSCSESGVLSFVND